MFTGLIEEVGCIAQVETNAAGSRIRVQARRILENVALGDSIAVDGACMTVIAFDDGSFSFEASPESLSKTNFSSFQPGKRVNLERPLTPSSRIGGHYVTGHVDGLAKVLSREVQGNSIVFTFEVPSEAMAALLVPKGSVAILGISLTVNTVSENRFTVAIIPHTLSHTNLGDYQPGNAVNIETDLLGKYVQRLMSGQQAGENPYCAPPQDGLSAPALQPELTSVYPTHATVEENISIDAPSLAPAMNSIGLTRKPPATAQIHTGSWFNHDPE
ncbi:riboflavin synthase [Vampirovibrio chlorellavorus]|uniref:riboflavin synthase n=1 Tax=Vampirovibrio chlorellavorus TaxID=758823 RepID=UPI0026F34871|nr:riboflavin synthase [Vampirovibrio chlorellavorus]